METSERKWTDYTDEEKLLVIDGYLDGVVALDDENENANKQRIEWIRAHIPAYKVNEGKNYIFVSYSHLDYKEVYKDLAAFSYNSQRRVRFWYDEGLPIGQDWEKAAGELIKNPHCVGVLFYLSKNLLLSPSVFKEIEYVKNSGKPYFTIALDGGSFSVRKILAEANADELSGVNQDALKYFFPEENTSLYNYGKENLLARIDKIAEKFDVTEEVFSDFVCEECDGGLNLVAYRGNKTEVYIPERIGDKNIVKITADFPHAVSIFIPKTVFMTSSNVFDSAGNLEEIRVDENNPKYFDINGVLCGRNWGYKDSNDRIIKGDAILRAPICWDWRKQFVDYQVAVKSEDLGRLLIQLDALVKKREGTMYDRFIPGKGYSETYAKLIWGIPSNIDFYNDLFSFAIAYLGNGEEVIDFGYAIIYCKINVIYNFIKKLKNYSVFKDIKIVYDAFCGCKNLDYLFLYDGIEEVGSFANSALKLIFLPNSLREIMYNGYFRGCSKLQSILTDTDYYETHDERTLNKALFCGNLEKIVCDISGANITGVIFNENIELRNCQFIKCDWLYEITLPKVTLLYKAFSHCVRLKKVILGEGTERLSEYCFNNCISLKYIKIPKSVKSIAADCFWCCDNLETIEYGGIKAEWYILENYNNYGWKSQGKGVRIVCTDGVIEPSY